MPDPQSFPIDEAESGSYTATVVGNDGATALAAATLVTLTLTLYVVKADGTEQVVNARNQQNVLNANNGTVSAAGALVWTVQAADTALVEDIPFEVHYALFEWTWAAGAGKHLVALKVRNLRRVP